MRAPIEFTIEDRWGQPHEYIVPLFPVDEGVVLFGQIMALFSGPLATVASSIVASMAAGGTLADGLETEFDSQALGNQLRTTLMGGAPPKLLVALVSKAARDGKPLREAGHRDDAFAGNYLELVIAAWKIIEGNGWSPLDFMLSIKSVRGLVATVPWTASGSDASA